MEIRFVSREGEGDIGDHLVRLSLNCEDLF